MINPPGVGTERVGCPEGLTRSKDAVLGRLWFAPCGCFFLVEAGSETAESFSFSPRSPPTKAAC